MWRPVLRPESTTIGRCEDLAGSGLGTGLPDGTSGEICPLDMVSLSDLG
ncbi:MAG: hypothetical protein AAF799_46125 [Myxococcota bacterium]